jgi:formiminotetrahydrofolate cyclodeaminase
MSRLKSLTISEFCDLVSSKSPTPGGGSTACLVGAMAASLLEMYLVLSIGKEKCFANEPKLIDVQNNLSGFKEKLLDLADSDAEAFSQVMAAYKGGNDEEIQKALFGATSVPAATCKYCGEIIKLAKSVEGLGNANAESDLKSAIHLAKGALLSALENVEINLKEIKDETFKEEVRKKVYTLRSLC